MTQAGQSNSSPGGPQPVKVTFLLGPAGSGKTTRCLEEIRQELLARPQGPPLLFLAPKQATFQLERQLLSKPELPGYTRLEILSFERLARDCVEGLRAAPVPLLSEEGRLMVLRALLVRHHARLRVFRAVARLPGFAQQLNAMLRECQRHQLGPERLRELAGAPGIPAPLAGKLEDVADLMESYGRWLQAHALEDAQRLLDWAAQELRAPAAAGPFALDGLWLDGFAELTPQELDLLAALIPACRRATLAFCLDPSSRAGGDWFDPWQPLRETYHQCRRRLEAVPGCQIQLEALSRPPTGAPRFQNSPALSWLESHWGEGRSTAPAPPEVRPEKALRLVACANPEAEAVCAAREICQFVQAGGRYREVAVLVRNLDTHAAVLRRVLKRFDIPFFLDQREPVAHHPLVELTRGALRLAAFGWRHDDWFAVLKSGLIPLEEEAVDQLENEALEQGWEGEFWQKDLDLAGEKLNVRTLEVLRRRVVGPFAGFTRTLGRQEEVAGETLSSAIRRLWDELKVAATLEHWATRPPSEGAVRGHLPGAVHATVWTQMNDWLENLEQAFRGESLTLADWLAVLEAGVSSMTVGVIPPALDQVLVGAVDRSRNPDLQLALVLGFNEGWLPAPPPSPPLLSEAERDLLEQHQAGLGLTVRQRLARECYLGYIACTRARRRLVLTWAMADEEGQPLNPSPLLANIQAMFPAATVESFGGEVPWPEAVHPVELLSALVEREFPLATGLEAWRPRLERLKHWQADEALAPEMAFRLYGPELKTSVTALERYGACPFQFFVSHGLRAEERRYFEVDTRETGSLQHKILETFHRRLQAQGRRWRDLPPAKAKQWIADIADAEARRHNNGLFLARPANRFQLEALKESLQDFIATIMDWMQHYQLDPAEVEWSFGTEAGGLPPWVLELENGRRLLFRGKIDRVDVGPGTEPGSKLCVVMDYKSSEKKLDPVLLAHGVQMQLPAYLSFLCQCEEAARRLGAQRLVPVGVFYVNLRGHYESASTRQEALDDADSRRRQAFQHVGRFNLRYLRHLDARPERDKEGQFKFRLKKDGTPYKGSPEAMSEPAFQQLLEGIAAQLRRMGNEIYQGRAAVDPYQKKKERACENCLYQGICRIDPWTHQFRLLREPAEPEE